MIRVRRSGDRDRTVGSRRFARGRSRLVVLSKFLGVKSRLKRVSVYTAARNCTRELNVSPGSCDRLERSRSSDGEIRLIRSSISSANIRSTIRSGEFTLRERKITRIRVAVRLSLRFFFLYTSKISLEEI